MNPWRVRAATLEDAGSIRSIYAPYVEDTSISFETIVPTVDEMRTRISDVQKKHLWLVYERDHQILGYAYASPHRSRDAYRWSVDVAAYAHKNHVGQGIGRALYRELLSKLEQAGFANAFAGIALPNPASVALHESFGFAPVGIYRKVGYKNGQWHDTGWWQKPFRHSSAPQEPGRF